MEETIRALLLADSGVSSLADRSVNLGSHPQGRPFPAAVLNVISDAEGFELDGPDGLSRARMQVDCYAATYGVAKQFSRAVRSALNGYASGAIQGVFHAGTRDSRDGGTNEVERLFRVSLDFNITYKN